MISRVPGVSIQEVSRLAPSVVGVSTAIPAFIGHTMIRKDGEGQDLEAEEVFVERISSLAEYESIFGKPMEEFMLMLDNVDKPTRYTFTRKPENEEPLLPSNRMYYSLQHYFGNGGGSCYVVSVGKEGEPHSSARIKAGITALEKFDEPSLIVLIDAQQEKKDETDPTNPLPAKDYYLLCQEVLNHCNKMKDRFGIFDLLDGDEDAIILRETVTDYLMYGAAYGPLLETSIPYLIDEKKVEIMQFFRTAKTTNDGLKIIFAGLFETTPTYKVEISAEEGISFKIENELLTITIQGPEQTSEAIAAAWDSYVGFKGNFGLMVLDNTKLVGDSGGTVELIPETNDGTEQSIVALDSIKINFTQVYNQLKQKLNQQSVVLPPSAAIAGIYARTDRNTGVWKAPANTGINALNQPYRSISDEAQGRLNVDPTSGKSVNAIRTFTGLGTLVWGARTLAGNDNEWRYVNVRRLFIFIEESIQKATQFAVFESNTNGTWQKVKTMIESFLFGLWQQGALAGPDPQSAYFVQVGLGKTMTPNDVLSGKMIVEIGVAAVRPAEFIVLKFSHQLQQA